MLDSNRIDVQQQGGRNYMDRQPEQIGPYVTLEWLYGGRVAVLKVTSIQFEAIDAWAETAIRVVAQREPGEPHLVVHDVSAPGLTFTPYVRDRLRYAVSQYPDAPGRTAVVAPKGMSGAMLRLVVNQVMRVISGREVRAFTDRDAAIAWVSEKLD